MRSRLLAAVVADDLVDLYDDVLGNAGLFGSAIDHLCEVDALQFIDDYWLCTCFYGTTKLE